MKLLRIVNLVLVTALGISTGAVKLAGMAQEMAIFRNAGSPDWLTVAFGLVQIVAAVLLVPSRTRRAGGITLAATFALATTVLFVNGLLVFGAFSLIFIAMAALAATSQEARLEARADRVTAATP